MPRKLLFTATLFSIAFAASCVQSGVARLPARSDILVTTGDVEWNYEALAFIEVQQVRCAPCGNLETSYDHLSETIKEDFKKHAKDLGATAVINVKFMVMGSGLHDIVVVIGTAVKPTGTAQNVLPKDLKTISVRKG